MTEPSDQQVPAEPHEGIDAFDNKDAKAYEENQSSPLSRVDRRRRTAAHGRAARRRGP